MYTHTHTITHTHSHTITHNHTHTITLSHTLSHTIQTHRFVEEKPVWSSVSTPHTVAKKEGSNALAHRCCQKKGKGLRLWIITWYVCQLSTLTLFGSASAGWMNGVVYVQTFFFFSSRESSLRSNQQLLNDWLAHCSVDCSVGTAWRCCCFPSVFRNG